MKSLKIDKNSYLTITVFMALLITLSPFAIDTYLAAMPDMAVYFGVSQSVIVLTVTLYFLGFAIGNFLGGPLSDSFGRKPIALFGVGLFGVCAILIPVIDNINVILILRLFQAIGGGFATVTANVFVHDWYTGNKVAKLITVTSMMTGIAPLIAPIIGKPLINSLGWHGVFYFLFVFAILLFMTFLVFIPESRNKDLITNNITIRQLLRNYKVFFSNKRAVTMLFAISFAMAGMFVFITNASFIYIDYFKIDSNKFPLLFGSSVGLSVVAAMLNNYLLKFYNPKVMLRSGLIIQLLAGLVLVFLVKGINPSFWSVFIAIVIFSGNLSLIIGNGTAVLLSENPEVSASANATIGIFSFLLSALVGSIAAAFNSNNLVPICLAMFLCSLTANVLSFIITFYERKRSLASVKVIVDEDSKSFKR